jgi:hypothetical protein
MATINITRDDDGNVVYDPPEITIATAGDFVIWANLDDQAPHQPTLEGQAADYWMNDPLPPFEVGQPAACSPVINLAGTAGQPITYVDGLEPDAGSGTINFV